MGSSVPSDGAVRPPLLEYVAVGEELERRASLPRYSREQLRMCLQFAGWKPKTTERAVDRVFRLLLDMARLSPADPACLAGACWEVVHGKHGLVLPRARLEGLLLAGLPHPTSERRLGDDEEVEEEAEPPGSSEPRTPALADLRSAMRVAERQACVVVVLCGTSGTGKSTLAALLSARLGLPASLSSDSVRSALRTLAPDPLLTASSYSCGALVRADLPGDPRIRGFLAQCEPVAAGVERALAAAMARRESIVLEGVHLRPSWASEQALRYGDRAVVLPFLVSIANERKHAERFAVRAKTMTLRPDANRYIQHLRSIRVIQEALTREALLHDVPRLNNTNVDRSLDTIHGTLLACLRARARGVRLVVPPAAADPAPAPGKRAALDEACAPREGATSLGPTRDIFRRRQSSAWSGRAALQDIRLARQRGADADGDDESAGPSGSSWSLHVPLTAAGSSLSLAGLAAFQAAGSDSSGGSGAGDDFDGSAAVGDDQGDDLDDLWAGGSVLEEDEEEGEEGEGNGDDLVWPCQSYSRECPHSGTSNSII